jgi:hypothetical protein
MNFIDPKFRLPRIWSNEELLKISPMFDGKVVNASGWKDLDKQGGAYSSDYFSNASEYWITNWEKDARGFQGNLKNEIYLDLEKDLPDELKENFDVVFNHTTLEHVFDVFKAFENLCLMSKDVVIVVVPFAQEQHGSYGDYWRFTPWGIKRMFERFDVVPTYISANDGNKNSIYVFAVGTKSKKWFDKIHSLAGNMVDKVEDEELFIGKKLLDTRSIIKKIIMTIKYRIQDYLKE